MNEGGDGQKPFNMTNAAWRMLATFDRFRAMNDNQFLSSSIANWFGEPDIPGKAEPLLALRRIGAAIDDLAELGRVLARQQGRQFSETHEDFSLDMRRILYGLVQSNLTQLQWGSYKGNFSDALRQQLRMYALALPDDEPEFDQGELEELANALRALKKAAADPATPASVRASLEEQVAKLQQAIEAYHLRGPHAFVEVVLAAAYARKRREADLEHASDAQRSLLVAAWGKVEELTSPLRLSAELLGVYEIAKMMIGSDA